MMYYTSNHGILPDGSVNDDGLPLPFWGSRSGTYNLGYRVRNLRCERCQGWEFRVQGLECRVQGLKLGLQRVQGFGIQGGGFGIRVQGAELWGAKGAGIGIEGVGFRMYGAGYGTLAYKGWHGLDFRV